MTKRVLALVLALSMSVGIVLSGCTDSGSTSSTGGGESTTSGGSEPSGTTDVGTFEDIEFPDSLPTTIVMDDGLDYSYDDLTEKYSIEIMSTSYGKSPLPVEEDPVNQWLSKEFNMDITLTAPAADDYQTLVSTRFSANEYPDILQLPSRDYGFTLSDQGLLVDAKNIYPYLPLSNNYTTKNMIQWSTNTSNGEIPFITKYAIQDGVWGWVIRQDWLDALDMEIPSTKDELLEFAKAVTFNDPDGNGKDDTYFMTGGGQGKGWGNLDGFATMFGNPAIYVENGELQHPYFNGISEARLNFFKELIDAKVMAPDWFTKNWDQACADMANYQVAMAWFPAGTFEAQIVTNFSTVRDVDRFVWTYLEDSPTEEGKYPANGNPGYMWAFLKEKFEGQDGKLKRVAHMIDTMTMGGKNYFQSIQQSIPEVYEAAGIKVSGSERPYGYTDDNKSFYLQDAMQAGFLTQDEFDKYEPSGIWQMWGLCTSYQIDFEDPDADEFTKKYVESGNSGRAVIAANEKWPNDGLLVTLTDEAAEFQTSNADWVFAQEYAFATGDRSFDDWDSFTQEWLDKGGKLVIQQAAEQLGVEVPDYAK